jgi:hydrogenase nickel incorporation protein HypA/HybF
MHELSIAQSILEIVQQYVPEPRDAAQVRAVRVRVGRMSGIVPETLEFCFTAITHDTPLESARLDLEVVPIRCRCVSCDVSFEAEPPVYLCPKCASAHVEVLSGGELQVIHLELVDSPAEVP